MTTPTWVTNPMFGITLSVVAYTAAQMMHKRWRWLHPLFVCSGFIILVLLSFRIPYSAYKTGGDLLTLLLGPATVALGVPLYKHAGLIRKQLTGILIAVTLGSLAGIASAAALVGLLGGSREILLSMLPKSVSSPIALEISRHLGGLPELTAVLTVLTGLFGSMFGRKLLTWLGFRDALSIGIAIGTAAHGIGTARLIKDSEIEGSMSGFAMGAAGIITSILFIPIYWWFS
ncbi:murein hydrolase effector protein LrgB [Paenibacillus pectinilyticus]|uniref:Murein hydrolase effector protein LrgB n=1 Tax=Paenibacillus pectinilyticus TaxID=512399 RepID=A0A1C1A4P2_9BACL|nr:LrgB family protein [Paenibacillus pectinilyticus]OCT15529.1 murein hydrolase effector protein LrgB [Paenibacillus pectinilyticus]